MQNEIEARLLLCKICKKRATARGLAKQTGRVEEVEEKMEVGLAVNSRWVVKVSRLRRANQA